MNLNRNSQEESTGHRHPDHYKNQWNYSNSRENGTQGVTDYRTRGQMPYPVSHWGPSNIMVLSDGVCYRTVKSKWCHVLGEQKTVFQLQVHRVVKTIWKVSVQNIGAWLVLKHIFTPFPQSTVDLLDWQIDWHSHIYGKCFFHHNWLCMVSACIVQELVLFQLLSDETVSIKTVQYSFLDNIYVFAICSNK